MGSRFADATLSGYMQAAISAVMLNRKHFCQVLPGDILVGEGKSVLLGICEAIIPVIYAIYMSSVDEQAPDWDKGTARTINFICVLFVFLPISTG